MLQVLSEKGLGHVLNALKNLYSNTKVTINNIGTFRTTAGIRQGASSSVYLFIVFINGLFQWLRDRFPDNVILGKIHNLIHADDTIILATSLDTLKQKVEATIDFYKKIEQSINIGKAKYMIIDSKKNYSRDKLVINDWAISYSSEEKYLGHYITDDNSMPKSIQLDFEVRGANVLVKFRNFVNNHPSATLEICLNVFQICFTTTILSNCETWGPWIPVKFFLYIIRG